MDAYTNRVHKLNAALMWVFALVLDVTAYVNGGIMHALQTGVMLFGTCLVVTGLAFLKVKNNLLKSIVISLLPAIGSLVYSISQDGAERMFTAYLVCACFAAVYFNTRVLLTYGSVISVLVIAVYAIKPDALLGTNSGFGEFLPRFGMFLCGTVALFFLSKWGNEHLLKTFLKM
jgi:methyl-accepting chemotaxis protein